MVLYLNRNNLHIHLHYFVKQVIKHCTSVPVSDYNVKVTGKYEQISRENLRLKTENQNLIKELTFWSHISKFHFRATILIDLRHLYQKFHT